MDQREIVGLLNRHRLNQARPWMAISSDYLTTKEFLSLIGIGGRGKEYRQALLYLDIASRRHNSGQLLPAYLRNCFRRGVVSVHVFQGRSKDLIGVEFRIPVDSLDEKYAERIKELISSRNGRGPEPISRGTLRKLRRLSEITHRSISEIIDTCVDREIEAVIGKPGDPAERHEDTTAMCAQRGCDDHTMAMCAQRGCDNNTTTMCAQGGCALTIMTRRSS